MIQINRTGSKSYIDGGKWVGLVERGWGGMWGIHVGARGGGVLVNWEGVGVDREECEQRCVEEIFALEVLTGTMQIGGKLEIEEQRELFVEGCEIV